MRTFTRNSIWACALTIGGLASSVIVVPPSLHAQGDRGYQAVCQYGGCGYKGPIYRDAHGAQEAQADATAHSKANPRHYVQVVGVNNF